MAIAYQSLTWRLPDPVRPSVGRPSRTLAPSTLPGLDSTPLRTLGDPLVFRANRTAHHMAAAALALVLCLTAATSHAVWHWMRGAAATDFKESDWTMLKETARRVLNDLPDHEQANWSNPETGNKGSVMVLATFQFEGQKCRRAAMRNMTYRGRDDRSAYTLCQQTDGDWSFVPESVIRASAGADADKDAGADAASTGSPEADDAATAAADSDS